MVVDIFIMLWFRKVVLKDMDINLFFNICNCSDKGVVVIIFCFVRM